jgi:hypothetical protein
MSINVQVVGDAEYCVRHVVARWPGSTHDSRIFNESSLRDAFEPPMHAPWTLLGDSAYPLLPYLITPVPVPNNDAEQRFNTAHSSTRVLVSFLNLTVLLFHAFN